MKERASVQTVKDTHHYEVPHASSFGHQRGDAAAAGHQDDLNGLGVQKVIQQLGGFPWVTLERQNDSYTDGQMKRWINNTEEELLKVIERERIRGRARHVGVGGRKMGKIRKEKGRNK